jgi:Holliday junction resolvase
MNAKEKGSRRERQAKVILERAGYHVIKAGGSLGLFDLVAVGPASVRLIQVKSNGTPRAVERERLELFPQRSYATKEIWIFYDRCKEPSIEIL